MALGYGTHRLTDISVSQVCSYLIPFFLLAAVIFALFLIFSFQNSYKRVYYPRTYLGSLSEVEMTPKRSSWTLSDDHVLKHSSLDNFLWLRFFKLLIRICLCGCLITWPILFPVNATGGGGQSGLDRLSFGNTHPGERYLAHGFTACIFLGFVMFLISREASQFVQLREAYFQSPFMTSRISSRTVLFIDVPESYRNEEHIRRILPQVTTVWLLKDTGPIGGLQSQVEDRDVAVNRLEVAETKLIKAYIKMHIEAEKRNGERNTKKTTQVAPEDPPEHVLEPMTKKVNRARADLHRLIPEIAEAQQERRSLTYQTKSAVFVEFESQSAAQAAFQQVKREDSLLMTPKDIGMVPEDIIWGNLGKSKWVRNIICWMTTLLVMGLCLVWSFPVGFVHAIMDLDGLSQAVSALHWINRVPEKVLILANGFFPTICLVLLMALVPIMCNFLGGFFELTRGAIQLRTQAWYFIFQVTQVFLITTCTTGAIRDAAEIAEDPRQLALLLARNLPKSTNFYVEFFVYYGFLNAAVQLLNLGPLCFFVCLRNRIDQSPRKKYNRFITLYGLGWGSHYPKLTNLAVIALSYSCIAPVVLGVATITFSLLYLAFRYNALFSVGPGMSTRGRAFARGLQQLTVGIYLSELCLIGLFSTHAHASGYSTAMLVLMILFLVATVIWHVQMRRVLGTPISSSTNEPTPSDSKAASDATPPSQSARKRVLGPRLSKPVEPYTEEQRRKAYLHPALNSKCPAIWIPEDGLGVSKREIEVTKETVGGGIEVTDMNAGFDKEGNLWWNEEVKLAPIWKEKPIF